MAKKKTDTSPQDSGKRLFNTDVYAKENVLKALMLHWAVIVLLPIVIIFSIDSSIVRFLLFLLWIGTIDYTSPFIQKHVINRLIKNGKEKE